MDVSIVVPTHNRSALLSATLGTVLRQRDVEFEIIVVDEASSDDTPATLAGLHDARLVVLRHDVPLGVSTARNRGAARARGEWLAFIDDDDLWAPDKLSKQIRAARALNRDWAYAGSVNITAADRIIYGAPPLGPTEMVAALPHYNAIPGGGSNVVMRHRVWRELGQFDTRLRNTEDWEMWIRLARHGLPACVPKPLVAYRVHTTNASLNVTEIARGTRLIEQMHGTTADWGRLHRWMAESCLRRGQRSAAVHQMIKAVVRGQGMGVLSDVRQVIGRRIAVHAPLLGDTTSTAADPWISQAAVWLADIQEGRPRLSETARTSILRAGPSAHG